MSLAALAATPAQAQRAQIRPHIDVGQVLTADLQGGDVLTYSTVGAGIDVSMHSRRVEVQLSYNYQHRFSYDNATPDDDVHSGIAIVRARVTPGLTLEAGGMAVRGRTDIRGASPGNLSLSGNNRSQIYSAYAGPNLSTHVGPMFVNGAYRFGYTRVEAPRGGTGVPGTAIPLDIYDDSTVHVATASAGVKSGTILPIGITVSGAYTRENAGQLDNRFEGKYGRGDVVLPIGRGLAIAGGVGYEQIRITQRDALVVGGVVQRDANGRFITDPASTPRIAYDTDGLFWDAGVIWRPSRRTFLEARVGKRYGSWSYTGSLSYQIGPGSGLQVGVYDSVTSFGQQANGGVAALPTSFDTDSENPFQQNNSGCTFGNQGSAAGSCMNGIFASAATGNYRARGVTGVLVFNRGPNHLGFGGGYARRDFIAPAGPGVPGISINGTSDQTYYAQIFAARELGRSASISGNAFITMYDSDLPGSDTTMGWGANGAYTQRFFGHLEGTAAVGVYGYKAQGTDQLNAQGLVGLRYGF
ncbi:hypothetical protein [Sphingomonas caeni]|uniref:hypothetical protein n=1 Tax=Sphingomonas caeni TaxID=2984949 RepID=UPI00222F769B|nr:hypothetical protein [Sphingomonas caeni]